MGLNPTGNRKFIIEICKGTYIIAGVKGLIKQYEKDLSLLFRSGVNSYLMTTNEKLL